VLRGGGQRRARIAGLLYRPAIRHQLGQSEIQDLRLAARSDEDVRRLNVAVNHAFRMGRIERVGNLNAKIEQLLQVWMMAREVAVERLAVNQLHGDEVFASGFADFIDGRNVGMIQRRGRACFELEPLERLLVLGQVFRQKLQRYAAAEMEVFCDPNGSHAARAKALDHLVVRDLTHEVTSLR